MTSHGHTRRQYYLMLAPALVWLVMFSFVPMGGIVIAFQRYNPAAGVFGSEFIGLEHFRYMFSLPTSWSVFRNTMIIAVGKIAGNLFVPLTFALLLNEVKHVTFKRVTQTIVYLPHFLSWVILAGILKDLLGVSGPVNLLIESFGFDRIRFFALPGLFRPLLVLSDVWKDFGFRTIVYLAALSAIDPTHYEVAAIDGANRWQSFVFITIPGVVTTAVLLAVLSLGGILNAGFDQVFNLYNPVVYETGDIVDTWVYRAGLISLQYELATAVGILKSVVGLVLISVSYYLAYKFTGYRIF